jgi:hypothetical protein
MHSVRAQRNTLRDSAASSFAARYKKRNVDCRLLGRGVQSCGKNQYNFIMAEMGVLRVIVYNNEKKHKDDSNFERLAEADERVKDQALYQCERPNH